MQGQGCVDCHCTTEIITLNAAALSNYSLTISLSSEVGSGSESDGTPISIILHFLALIDSGSSHCFVDSKFVEDHDLPTKSIPPVQLQLLDGSAGSHISQSITLSVRFPSGDVIPIDFYVTRLDLSCNIVLGYNWLSRCNLLIDWVKHSMTFHSKLSDVSSSAASGASAQARIDPSSLVSDIPAASDPPVSACMDPSGPVPSSKPPSRSRQPPPPYEPIYSYPSIPSSAALMAPKISIISVATFI